MPHHRLVVNVLVLVYLVSGVCSLIDEVVWLRLLKLIIGNTVYASSVVVSVFMGGLAIGAALMGRICDRIRKPLRTYARIELAITISVLLSPTALRLADTFYVWLWRTFHPGQNVVIFWQALLSALVLLVPTVLMGSTLPLLARFVTSVEKETGPLVGRLYALNMLGAAAGTFLAGFVLIRTVGVMGTLYSAAVLNVGVACGGYLLHRMSNWRAAPDVGGATPRGCPGQAQGPAPTASRLGLALLACGFFLSGLASIGYELLWMRSIIHSIGTFTYVFSAVLTVYLVGNVIGTMIGSRLVRHVTNPAATYAAVLFVLGATGVGYLPWLDLYNYRLLPWPSGQPVISLLGIEVPVLMAQPMIRCTILFLIPSIVMGIGFPLMVQAWVNRVHRVGLSTGLAYSVNTIGAVLGGLLTGFVLMPLLGLQASIITLGLVVVWVAALMWLAFVFPATRKWTIRAVVPVAAMFVSVCAVQIPRELFVRTVALSGREFGHDIVAMREGINTTVSVHKDPRYGALYLYTSGRIVAGTSRGFRGDQKLLGHFPVLLNRYAQQTLSVGFGTGESTACLAMHEIEQIDCVEIAPEVVDFALDYFGELNLGDQLAESVNMIYMDARNYLHLTEQSYDVIMSDCTGMTHFAENGSLFARDYFEIARDRLNEHGMFMSWIDTYTTQGQAVMNSVLGTMTEVFPYVTLWYPTPEPAPFFVVVGSEQPQKISIQHIARELEKPAVKESLAKINMRDVIDVLSCYIADQDDLRRFVKQYATNTDDFPFIEFITTHERAGRTVERNFFQTVRSDSVYKHLDWTGVDETTRQQRRERLDRVRQVARYVQLSQTSNMYDESLAYCLEGLKVIPDFPALLIAKRSIEREMLRAGLQGLAAGDPDTALSIARVLLDKDPNAAAAWVLISQANRAQDRTPIAIEAARRAVRSAPYDMSVYHNLWSILLWADDPQGAQTVLNQAVEAFGSDARQGTPAPVDHLGF
ncbi:MAG: fused MFS/spermidine synthase [Sedimentisphaerales bacterium]|nr:fused MFS/spermidine synthase [Sedimentisphaerales bacterium]